MSTVQTQYANDAFTTIVDALGLSDTAITVTDGSVFPPVDAPLYFYATLEDKNGQIEVVKVIQHDAAGPVLTVDRGVDSTAQAAWLAGDYIEMRPNSAVFEELRDHNHDLNYAPLVHDHTLEYVDVSGDVMTGQLKGIDPVNADDFTRKDYVDQLNFYDLAAANPGIVLADAEILTFIAVRDFYLPVGLTDSVAECTVASVIGNPSFIIKKDAIVIGSIDFVAGDKVVNSFTFTTQTSFTAGDILTVMAPPDTYSMEGLVFNLTGTLTF